MKVLPFDDFDDFVKCSCGCGYFKAYSRLELLVQEDMLEYGLQYPHVSVNKIKAYWKSKLS